MCDDLHLEENKRIARDFFAALNRADSAAIAAMYTDDAVLWTAGSLPFSGTFNKAQAVQRTKAVLSAFPEGLTLTITGLTAEDGRVRLLFDAHHRDAARAVDRAEASAFGR
jgi:ketosteroid isomerase-like protein